MFGFIKNLLTNNTKTSPQKEADINYSQETEIPNSSILELSINDIFILDYFDNREVITEAADWQKRNFGYNVVQRLEELTNSKYLRLSTISESLELLKLPELKNILKSKQLLLSGKKAQLIQRILENFTNDELIKYYIPVYKLTNSGQIFLKAKAAYLDNQKYCYGFSNLEIESEEFILKERNKNFTSSDALWSLILKKYLNSDSRKNRDLLKWADAVNIRIIMADFQIKRCLYEDALTPLLEAFCIDIAGWRQNGYVSYYKDFKPYNMIKIKIEEVLLFNPALKDTLLEIATPIFDKLINHLLPFSYFTIRSAQEILIKLLTDEEFDISTIEPDNELPYEYSKEAYFDRNY